MRGERTSPSPPTLFGINPPPPPLRHAPFVPGQRGDHWGGGLRTLSTPNISSMLDQKGGGTYFRSAYFPITLIFICRLLLRRTFSFCAFSYDACFHYASSPTTLNFNPRILLRRLRNKEGAERKGHFKKIPMGPKMLIFGKILWNTVK
jgi:hypothetical protein